MKNIKFTGENISAKVLVLAYFFPWVSALNQSMSGFSITSNGISPGMLSYFITGFGRLFMILAVLTPVCGAIILYQNLTLDKKFDRFYKPAHTAPVVFLLTGIIFLYFKMKPDTSTAESGGMFDQFSRTVNDMAPGAFDIMGYGIYLSLAAAVYLFLVNIGKVKDKEFYKAGTLQARPDSATGQ